MTDTSTKGLGPRDNLKDSERVTTKPMATRQAIYRYLTQSFHDGRRQRGWVQHNGKDSAVELVVNL